MKIICSTTVLNDTYNIWSDCPEDNERFCIEECFVDEDGLNISISCDDESLLYSDVWRFQNTDILLGLKNDQNRLLLAYAYKGLGWNYAVVSCDDADCLRNTETMILYATLGTDDYGDEFERQEELPEEFASTLRYALLQNIESGIMKSEDCNADDFDTTAIVDNPDIGCVITKWHIGSMTSMDSIAVH